MSDIKDGSPLFQWRNPEIAAGDFVIHDMRNTTEYGPYLPIDSIYIVNNSDEKIKITFNGGGNTRVIFPKQQKGYEGQSITAFKVENLGLSAISAELIEIEYQHSPYNADKYARDKMKPVNRILGLFGVSV
ncbi:hypothetical protein [Methanolobus sp.]|uniref:hypothetical protein n=1 Tax=Methanolobus sp. TaxID=1874737 RepID=UPI0025E4A09B|nr:hypothetical protein [Methanolobus sp.]